jgi:hypothetical protein
MDQENWEETLYQQVFDSTCAFIHQKRKSDTGFTKEDLKEMIRISYHRRDSDWEGRGPLHFIIDSATIAACESILAAWETDT